ncbi:cytochrome c oxidase subunit 6A, mitochondrial [Halyomorpha halys]|uniref:cytochrome c oxidase subunit 6A, mitochondrial n=1 Tax=Halyomorpha halys TaxID=286706 RepID=UPI0006D4C96A|nr:cytochrome c oxidase subunit 6A, mitochondrial-like [Halyomorpha halys]
MATSAGRLFVRNFNSSKTLFAELPSASAVAGDHGGGVKLWRNVSYFAGIPAVLLCMLNAYLAHGSHGHDRPEFKKYEHMRVRNKKFPWGDGNHSLFHNPHTNALPDGYEA